MLIIEFQLIAFINTVINCVTTRYGQGVHAWNLDYKHITMGAKVCYRFYLALYTQLTYTIARMGVPSPVYASSNPLQSFNYNNLLKNFPEQKGQNILFH